MVDTASNQEKGGSLSPVDLANLRQAIAITRKSVQKGEGPFGAVIAGPDGAVVMTQENTAYAMRDHTKHAESLLASRFCHKYYDDPSFRAASTLYSSMEPCAMCMFTMFKAGIGRVVYALSADRLYEAANRYGEWPRTLISSHECARLMNKPMVVEGPFIEDEAGAILEEMQRKIEAQLAQQSAGGK
ncbi:nucleoside deaminase [Pseudodesulfovibrio sp.]|uniref:nucleoside deaminase n=1 Tax=unclassified Pseudodesulfovibrio TaxID=2661612 RepID=UPI003B008F66